MPSGKSGRIPAKDIYRRSFSPSTAKYGNKKVELDGVVFDSKHEATRWVELKYMERAKLISNLRRQVRFELIPNQYENGKVVERKAEYVADFVYNDQDGKVVVEDAKGMRTDVYKIKRKLMLREYGIRIKEV